MLDDIGQMTLNDACAYQQELRATAQHAADRLAHVRKKIHWIYHSSEEINLAARLVSVEEIEKEFYMECFRRSADKDQSQHWTQLGITPETWQEWVNKGKALAAQDEFAA